MNTYQRFSKPSIVKDVGYCGMEVIQINFAVRLEFMKEIEEAERESSGWAVPSGGEPSSAEQLDAGRGRKTI